MLKVKLVLFRCMRNKQSFVYKNNFLKCNKWKIGFRVREKLQGWKFVICVFYNKVVASIVSTSSARKKEEEK